MRSIATRRGSVLLLLVCVMALAGCTGPSGPAGGAQPIDADRAVELARQEATSWQPDAELVLLPGIEASEGALATREVPDEEGRSTRPTPVDPKVPDGRAPTWSALFYSEGADRTIGYRISAQGVEDLGGQAPSQRPTPLRNWSLASSEAVGIALGNTSFRQTALASDASVVGTLGMQDGIPIWQLVARSGSAGEHVKLLVDAANGTLISPTG